MSLRGPVAPSWLPSNAKKVWKRKVANYKKRKIDVVGLEGPLAHYCALEAALNDTYRSGAVPTAALLTVYRQWATQFFDTPESSKAAPAQWCCEPIDWDEFT